MSHLPVRSCAPRVKERLVRERQSEVMRLWFTQIATVGRSGRATKNSGE